MRRISTFIALSLVGCTAQRPPVASQEAPKTATESAEVWYVINAKRAPFYEFGPAQPTGPTLGLKEGDMLTLIKRETGFSRVRLEDGKEGYVANDFMKETPHVPFRLNSLDRPTRAEQQEFVPPTFIDDTPLPTAEPAPLINFR